MRKLLVSMGASVEFETSLSDADVKAMADADPYEFFGLENTEIEITIEELEAETESEIDESTDMDSPDEKA